MSVLAMKIQCAAGIRYFSCMLVWPGKNLNAPIGSRQLNLNPKHVRWGFPCTSKPEKYCTILCLTSSCFCSNLFCWHVCKYKQRWILSWLELNSSRLCSSLQNNLMTQKEKMCWQLSWESLLKSWDSAINYLGRDYNF